MLVKRLVTIEDLGNIEVLFTDKTGTLTEGAITFDEALDRARGCRARARSLLGLVCNEATMTDAGPGRRQRARRRARLGAEAAAAAGRGRTRVPRTSGWASCRSTTSASCASVVVALRGAASLLVMKGAPEAVLARCADVPGSGATRVLEQLFDDGARVVAVATRRRPASRAPAAGGRDAICSSRASSCSSTARSPTPAPRSRELAELGIAVKIITGDNGTVAGKVCRDIGLDGRRRPHRRRGRAPRRRRAGRGDPGTTIFARVGPEQKSRIDQVARRTGADVAFLGDGVNDAVALHAADVGISVDSATDVAKDAADIILLDKDLGVLADGVAKGRRIFANTIKYVLMATSSNFGNMFSAAGASLFLSFLPMLPSQILLNNLLYDGSQMTIPTDNVDEEMLARPAAWDIGVHPQLHDLLRAASARSSTSRRSS